MHSCTVWRSGSTAIAALVVSAATTAALTTTASAAPTARTTTQFESGAAATYLITRTGSRDLHTLRTVQPHCSETTSPETTSPADAARSFLRTEHRLLGLDDSLETLNPLVEQESLTGYHVRYTQVHDGVPVWRSSLAVHLNQEMCVTGVDVNLAPVNGVATEASVELADGIGIAYDELRLRPIGKEPSKVGHDLRSEQVTTWNGVPELAAPPTAELVIFAPGNGLQPRLAWRVLLDTAVPFGNWEILVDATDGTMLARHDRGRYAVDGSGSVFLPNACIALRNETLVDMNDADAAVAPAAYSDVTLRDLNDPVGGMYRLTGPYVTLEDFENPVIAPPLLPSPNFVFTRNPDGFEAVMIYYHLDTTQRYIQELLGFTNVMNRQLRVDAHGLNGADNSHYVGSPPGMGFLAFGDGGVDDGEDGDVINHEYGHAIHDNQVPGWGSTTEGGAMGEGFGDYLAGTMHAQYNFENECVAMWDATSYSSANPPCLRRLDSTKLYPGDIVGQVHADGEIWSAALWQCHNAVGRNTFNTILLESHFSVPTNGGFRVAALALLDADQALFGGVNSDTICQIMTMRGILMPSDCPAPRAEYTSHTIDDSLGDADSAAEPGEPILMPVDLTNTGIVPLTSVRATLTSDRPALIAITDADATWPDMAVGARETTDAPHYAWMADPAFPCGEVVNFTVDITSNEWTGSKVFAERIGEAVAQAPLTGTFTGSIPIPDNNPTGISNVINLAGAGSVGSVSVSINIPHTWIGDLTVTLTSPSMTTVTLHNESGGNMQNLVRTYPVPTMPDGPGTMADFTGEPAAGAWTLRVVDGALDDFGTLDMWSITVDAVDYVCDFNPMGCAATLEAETLLAVKLGSDARITWPPSVDPCHARYRIYRSTTVGMRPVVPPGTWPTDPIFTNVSASDLDGIDTNESFDFTPSGAIEYFKLIDVGTNGGEGPVGSFGR